MTPELTKGAGRKSMMHNHHFWRRAGHNVHSEIVPGSGSGCNAHSEVAPGSGLGHNAHSEVVPGSLAFFLSVPILNDVSKTGKEKL